MQLTDSRLDYRRLGSYFGLAVGDAWGDPVEFSPYPAIRQRFGARGPEFPAVPRITDDTQMSLAAWDAISEVVTVEGDFDFDALGDAFAKHYLGWAYGPDNDRAPGMSTMSSCGRLRSGATWDEAASLKAGGCGSVMRAPWIGVHPHISDNLPALALIAQVSAVVTHADPGAVAAAECTAVLARMLMTDEVAPGKIVDWLDAYAKTGVERWIKSPVIARVLSQAPVGSHNIPADPRTYALEAWAQIADAATDARELAAELKLSPWGFDASVPVDRVQAFGDGGWGAVSCLAIAVGILDAMAPGDCIRRAIMTGGDSDSIGAVVGGLAGAAYGLTIIDADNVDALERKYRKAIKARGSYTIGPFPCPDPVFA